MSGQVNNDSITTVRIKLGWVPLWEVPVFHKRFYVIGVPFALRDMHEYNYLYAEGLDKHGHVIANTRLTNLKYDSSALYAKAVVHGLIEKAKNDRPVIMTV